MTEQDAEARAREIGMPKGTSQAAAILADEIAEGVITDRHTMAVRIDELLLRVDREAREKCRKIAMEHCPHDDHWCTTDEDCPRDIAAAIRAGGEDK